MRYIVLLSAGGTVYRSLLTAHDACGRGSPPDSFGLRFGRSSLWAIGYLKLAEIAHWTKAHLHCAPLLPAFDCTHLRCWDYCRGLPTCYCVHLCSYCTTLAIVMMTCLFVEIGAVACPHATAFHLQIAASFQAIVIVM